MRHFQRKFAHGYTLVEVIIASALLIAVSVPMLRALTKNYVFANSIQYKSRSVAFAKSRLDRAKTIAANRYNTSLSETNVSVGEGYLCSVSDSGYNSDIRTVAVTAGYDKDQNGFLDSDEIEITLSSLIARR